MMYYLLIIFSSIFALLWTVSLHHLCMTSITNRQQTQKSSFNFLFCTITLLTNSSYYFSVLYPNHILIGKIKVDDLNNLCEFCCILIGTHIYRIYLVELFDSLFKPMGRQPPIFIQYVPMFFQLFITITTISSYTILYLTSSIPSLYICYIVIDAVIFIILVILFFFLCKVVTYSRVIESSTFSLKSPLISPDGTQRMKMFAHGAMYITILLAVIDTILIFNSCCMILGFHPFSHRYNELLLSNIVYSMFLIVINIPLFIWAHKKYNCCMLDQDSICVLCGCSGICFYEKTFIKFSQKTANFINVSGGPPTRRNSNATNITNLTYDQTINTLQSSDSTTHIIKLPPQPRIESSINKTTYTDSELLSVVTQKKSMQ
eukprot:135713_1